MVPRALATTALLSTVLLSTMPARAQGRAPRSPTEQAVSLRQGSPDLALDSRMAGTPTSTANTTSTGGWTEVESGFVLIVLGSVFIVGSAVAAGLAVDAAGYRSGDPYDQDLADGTARFFGVTSAVAGSVGLGLFIPGVVLATGQEPASPSTARLAPTGASLDVRF